MPRLHPDSPAAEQRRENERFVHDLTARIKQRPMTIPELHKFGRLVLEAPNIWLASAPGELPFFLLPLYQLIQLLVRDNPRLSSAEEARLVDQFIEAGMVPKKARHQVALIVGKTDAAVAKAHQRTQRTRHKSDPTKEG